LEEAISRLGALTLSFPTIQHRQQKLLICRDFRVGIDAEDQRVGERPSAISASFALTRRDFRARSVPTSANVEDSTGDSTSRTCPSLPSV